MPCPEMSLSSSLSHCESHPSEATGLVTCAAVPHRPAIADTWYSLSYLYYSAVGCLGCIAAGVIISFVTGWIRGSLSLGPRKSWVSLKRWGTSPNTNSLRIFTLSKLNPPPDIMKKMMF